MKRLVVIACLAVVVFLGVACGSGDKGPILGSETPKPNVQITAPPAATAGPAATAVATAAPQGAGPADLSLVYIDSRTGPSTLFVARYDGQSPKQVVTLPNGARPLDVRGGTLLLANGARLLVIDLKTNETTTVTTDGDVRDGRFLDDATFLYTTSGSCGGGPGGGAPPMSRVWRLDMKTQMVRELTTGRGNTIKIVGVDPQGQRFAVVKYGCDPGIAEFYVLEAGNGAEAQKVSSRGCGNAAVSIERKLALISWAACGNEPNKPTVTGAVYDFANAQPAVKDFQTAPGTGLNNGNLLLKPGGRQIAIGTQEILTTPRAGGPRSTGVFVYDFASGIFASAIKPEGGEQSPVSWSPDGRFLLAETVQAQGVCSYSFVDTMGPQFGQLNFAGPVTKVDEKITGCGVNGTMVGWTKLP